jgi:hypothetical protein
VTTTVGGTPKVVVNGDGITVSGTIKVAGASGDEVCDADHLGLIRRNPTTGSLQICLGD